MADGRLELAAESGGSTDRGGVVPAPLPPDDPEAWYAPDIQVQYEVYPGVVVTITFVTDIQNSCRTVPSESRSSSQVHRLVTRNLFLLRPDCA